MKETFNKLSIEKIYLNIVKAAHDKPTANIILYGKKKLESFPLRSGIIQKGVPGTQWLRIHLPKQGTQVQSLVQEDST